MQRKELIKKILEVVKSNSLGAPSELPEYETNNDIPAIAGLSLGTDFDMDELDYIEMIMELEEEFNLPIPDEVMPDWYSRTEITIDEIADVLANNGVEIEE